MPCMSRCRVVDSSAGWDSGKFVGWLILRVVVEEGRKKEARRHRKCLEEFFNHAKKTAFQNSFLIVSGEFLKNTNPLEPHLINISTANFRTPNCSETLTAYFYFDGHWKLLFYFSENDMRQLSACNRENRNVHFCDSKTVVCSVFNSGCAKFLLPGDFRGKIFSE